MATLAGGPELAFEKGYYEIKQWVWKVPAQDTDTSQKRCAEHLGQCESSIPATDSLWGTVDKAKGDPGSWDGAKHCS